jgi:hypothetical protein
METTTVAVLLTCVVGLNFTTFNSVPFALVTNMVATADAGMYMGVLNSAGVVAQTVTNSLASPILSWKDQNVAWAIAFGGILAGVGKSLSLPLRLNRPCAHRGRC